MTGHDLPAHVEAFLKKGPKFALEPRPDPVDLVTVAHELSNNVPEENKEKCVGDAIECAKNGNWSRKATVLKEVAPRSYLVKTESHRQLRRNRQQLLRTHEHWANENGYESGLEDCEPPDMVGPTVEGLEPANCPDNAAAADPQSTRAPEETEQTESAGDPSELPNTSSLNEILDGAEAPSLR
ncbi:hypothetical protein MTO96_024749 [Rhipicephalus appendiculatus]